MTEARTNCPFAIGDLVIFSPSDRTRGLYQDIERFGVPIGAKLPIVEIRDDCYLYFADGIGGWPWVEFKIAGPRESIPGFVPA